ncbi:beta-N-acetylhexosaminidase [Carnobacterium sp.]|uniref:beta-N-acetylhexosaminidase n=1 Tax=Carnobacterium sp. TaxID=48221 RepID=UPI0028AA804A|nr:beta-N-acetylhexosaminidase [Carnobacterium sp.]
MMWELVEGSSTTLKAVKIATAWLENHHNLKPTKIYYQTIVGNELAVRYDQASGTAHISGSMDVHLFRGLGLLLEMQQAGISEKRETMQFNQLGFMLEASRNAVMNIKSIKQFIVMLALMGYTGLYLYMEDTYEISSRPYFGYLRGRFSQIELQEIDQYAQLFGIEVVPCIQTLAHLSQALKWETMAETREDKDTLLVGSEATYAFILDMLETVKATFSSNKVHIGLDESYGVGLGQYLNLFPYTERFTLIKAHLEEVVSLCRELDLKPLVWSDFIYHTLDKKGLSGYYPVEAEINKKKAESMPKDVTYVYWDYGEFDSEKYEKRIENHRLFADDVVFAGGIHIYGAIAPNHGKSLKTLNPALMTCKKTGVKKILATTWGDNGQETSHWNALPIMQWYAEHAYHEEVTAELAADRFATCVQPGLYDSMLSLRFLDEVPGVEPLNHYMANPSKFLLWQDPLLGLFDEHVHQYQKDGNLVQHYKESKEAIASHLSETIDVFQLNLQFYQSLAAVLELKATFGIDLLSAYQDKQMDSLKELVDNRIPAIINAVETLRNRHSAIWLATYKAFGWETLDIRYGGLLQRLKTAHQRIGHYITGEINQIAELEEQRLPFLSGTTPLSINVPDYNDIAFTGYH